MMSGRPRKGSKDESKKNPKHKKKSKNDIPLTDLSPPSTSTSNGDTKDDEAKENPTEDKTVKQSSSSSSGSTQSSILVPSTSGKNGQKGTSGNSQTKDLPAVIVSKPTTKAAPNPAVKQYWYPGSSSSEGPASPIKVKADVDVHRYQSDSQSPDTPSQTNTSDPASNQPSTSRGILKNAETQTDPRISCAKQTKTAETLAKWKASLDEITVYPENLVDPKNSTTRQGGQRVPPPTKIARRSFDNILASRREHYESGQSIESRFRLENIEPRRSSAPQSCRPENIESRRSSTLQSVQKENIGSGPSSSSHSYRPARNLPPAHLPLPSTVIDKRSLPQQRGDRSALEYYLKFETYILFLIFVIASFHIVFSEMERQRLIDDFPTYNFNLDRSQCITENINSTFKENCLNSSLYHLLNQTYLHNYCQESLKNIVKSVLCGNKRYSLARVKDPPVIQGQEFYDELLNITKEKFTENVADLYALCVRVFEYNPFGDVEVLDKFGVNETSIIKHNFMYRNLVLMMKCKTIPSDSHPFVEMPTIISDPRQLTFYIFFTAILSLITTLVCIYCRKTLCNECFDENTPSTQSPLYPDSNPYFAVYRSTQSEFYC